jgi:outer membrane protein TolC
MTRTSTFRFFVPLIVFILTALDCSLLNAQSSSQQQATRAQQPQLSGRQSQQSGSVTTQQSANQSGSSSVNTSTTTVQVQGNYTGSVPNPDGNPQLTLESAIRMGLHYNLGAVSASVSLRQQRALRLSALSQLLPTVSASVSETGAKTDLQTLGLGSGTFGGGLALPATVGPYHYYDARATVNYNFFDRTAHHNYLEAKAAEHAAEMSDRDARELVVLAVGGEYLKILSDLALVESQEAQVKYAKSSFDQATAQMQAGTKSPVDAQKSQVEYQTEEQRLTSQRSDLTKDERTLARAIGLPQAAALTFAEKLPFTPAVPMPLDEALRKAFADRPDLKSAQMQLIAAEEALKASRAEHLPTGNVNGYVAVEGVNPNHGNGVFSGEASLSIPIFQGGRIKADEQQAQAAIDQRRAEYEDQRGVVEQEVRNAYLDFQVATDQVKLAQSNRDLALTTLQQSQDRFTAGVATSVEVVQSQESLAAADRDYISSLYAHNLAKIDIARAIGQAESTIPTILKGQ